METKTILLIIIYILEAFFCCSVLFKIIRCLWIKPYNKVIQFSSKYNKKTPKELENIDILVFSKSFFGKHYYVTENEKIMTLIKSFIENAQFMSINEYENNINKANAKFEKWSKLITIMELPAEIIKSLGQLLLAVVIHKGTSSGFTDEDLLRMKYPNATEDKISLASTHGGEDYLKNQ